MIVVRQWMTNYFKPVLACSQAALLISTFILVSCNPTEVTSSGQRAGSGYAPAQMVNKAYIYRDSPAINQSVNNVSMKGSTDLKNPEFITSNSLLKGDCTLSLFTSTSSATDCIRSYGSKTASQQLIPRKSDGTWTFATNSSEFYQVNGLYHVQSGVNLFFDKLKFAYDNLYSHPSFYSKVKSTPKYLPQTKMFWFQAITPSNDNYFRNNFLNSYALCNLELNASFSPAGPDLCFGKWDAHPSFLFIQDPSIVYHELGHALIAIMMNMRNGIEGVTGLEYHALRSNLNSRGYDESGSIGEGVADYYSFVMNKRTHIGEWALGKSLNASRPMSEDDASHISGIDTTSEGRLSYPQYLLYDPNHPTVPYEDIHYAGQIVSHYLVALTKEFQGQCSIPTANAHDISTSYVMMLLAETFSEIGDLKSVGIDSISGPAYNPSTYPYRFNNLDEFSSYMWTQVVNPPTYRRFFQTMAKNINKYMTNGLCSGFSRDKSEKLLDDYGLLLFKTYNNNGSSTKDKNIQHTQNGSIASVTVAPTSVNESNRRKSVLVSKQLIGMATPNTAKDVASYYLIDDATSVNNLLQNMLFKGYPMNPSTGIASVTYNNNNVKVSPGEIVAVIPNLFNSSNSPMAGVHLLANDWDHVHITDTSGVTGNFQPCVVDDVTTTAQGAQDGLTCANTLTDYTRHIKREVSPGVFKYRTTEAVAPVCLVQLEEGAVTRWVSQNEFRKKQGLELQDKDCLGYGGTAYNEDFTFNPHECLVRVLPGANQAFYSKIDAQKSYIETMRAGNPDHVFNAGNAVMFEVNKWIPPGTKFRCRMRAKFSNCSDCFSDQTDSNSDGIVDSNDDYVDSEFNGSKPYKVINFEFDVND